MREHTMMATTYAGEPVPVTPAMQDALVAYMRAMCAMMRKPGLAHYWAWGRCEVDDLARSDCLRFYYGPDEDRPDDGLGDFGVLVLTPSPEG